MNIYFYYFIIIQLMSVSSKEFNCYKDNLKYVEEEDICRENRIGVNDTGTPYILSKALRDIITAIPALSITLAFDNGTDLKLLRCVTELIQGIGISTRIYQVNTDEEQEKFLSYIKSALISYEESSNLIMAENEVAEIIINKIHEYDLINRNILYIFLWKNPPVSERFISTLLEAMRVAVIINIRPRTYRIYYNQAKPNGINELTFVNWWSHPKGIFKLPLLPQASKVFNNFAGRLFSVPVLHKPPWNYVNYENGTFLTNGGRDDQLLKLLAYKLNFRFEYSDPPERILGSGIGDNGTYRGVLGLIWQREAPFVLGDVTITYERIKLVDFSLPTLADCGAFITHSPRLLNEALAVLRPFHWQVWLPVAGTALLAGPVLFIIIEAPRFWRKKKNIKANILYKCIWFSVGIFLKQSVQLPSKTCKVRLITILLSIVVTYVIGGLYSATLTSLLARPAREQPIRTLEELEYAMKMKNYQLLVERHSSSLSILQNGTGVYGRLWMMMTEENLVDSVEEGMNYVQETSSMKALLGGWETLFFDSRRFGAHHFYLANCLFTRYSAIAMQTGSPYRENFDRIIIRLSQAGILAKMTEDEYERIGDKVNKVQNSETQDDQESDLESDVDETTEVINTNSQLEKSNEKSERKKNSNRIKISSGGSDKERKSLKPVSVKMLQGAFFVLVIGFGFSGLAFTGEILTANQKNLQRTNEKRHLSSI